MESNKSSASFDLNDFKNKMKSLKKSINELLQREKESDKGTDKELIQSLRNYVDARKKSNRRNITENCTELDNQTFVTGLHVA